ncbi:MULTISPECIES: glucose 1-dehydrogenase [Halorussus]|uniref:glucose 1-dehydrogenase n=1 Tax=Halorussus TaxID=1070314 RepID=UPI0020A1A44F|nr:glucose 1-dehydrogenase [Halorussus vallis]USZ78318.1 glucose 1-dehydrogenase [Halorussus vallis]USZ78341.1 glucose 1-dehydrogenase [Halorussus vallis]
MRAIAVRRDESEPRVIDVPKPTPGSGEALIRTLRIGIDGTDHEVVDGNHGGFPADSAYQILGHEAVGVVEDANDTDFNEGDLVVPTVRRPPVGQPTAEYFERGEPDMAPDGAYVERGIVGAHGYMSEYFTAPEAFLVGVPDDFATTGFLIEPISNSEKALEHAYASRSAFEWDPESALILGNGPLGLLTLAMLAGSDDFERCYCLGRRNRPDPTIEIIERLGATYIDSRETPLSTVPDANEPMDFIYEATGYAPHAFETVEALAPNGVGMLLGIPSDGRIEINGGRVHREMVLQNKALLGSVNSNVAQYETAKASLAAFPDWFADALVTDVHDPDEVERAFETGDDVIKSVVEFDTV